MNTETRITINSLVAIASWGTRAVVLFALVPFLIAELGEARFGVIGVISSLLAFVTMLLLGGRPGATRQFTSLLHSGELERANQLASTFAALCVALAGLLLLGLGLCEDVLLKSLGVPSDLIEQSAAALFLAAAGVGLVLTASPYLVALGSQLRYDIRYYIDMVEVLARAGLIVLLFWLWRADLIAWGTASLIPAGLVWGIARWQAYAKCRPLSLSPRHVSRRGLSDLWGSGLFTLVVQISGWFTIYSGPLVISYFLGTTAVAHYTPVILLATGLQVPSRAFLIQLEPVLTRAVVDQDFARIRRVLLRSARYTLLLSGGAAVWFGLLAPLIIRCWLGEGFEDTVIVLRLWCAAVVLQSAVGGAFAVFLGAGKYRMVGSLNAILGAAVVASVAFLIGGMGYGIGAVAASVVAAQVVRTAIWIPGALSICGLDVRRLTRESYRGPALCLLGLSLVELTLERSLAASAWVELAVAGSGSLITYAFLAWAVGLSLEDRTKAAGYLRQGWSRVLRRRSN